MPLLSRQRGPRYRSSPALPMKLLAGGLLLLAALLFLLAHSRLGEGPVWGYLAAFSEAAMVGAIADWFAVTALFRRPLGLPIPHTAIIPQNKTRIGLKLADFIVTHFLSTQQVLARLQDMDIASGAAGWFRRQDNAEAVARQLAEVGRFGIDTLLDEKVQAFFQNVLLRRVRQLDVAPLLGELLEVLTRQGRHQFMLDELLARLSQALDKESTQALLARVIASEIKALRYLGLGDMVGGWSAKRVVRAIRRLIAEVAENSHHPLRQRFDAEVLGFAEKLKSDPGYRLEVERIVAELLEYPATLGYLQGVWRDLVGWLKRDLQRSDSTLQKRAVEVLVGLGEALSEDAGMRQWVNRQLLQAAPRAVERYRGPIGDYIAQRVEHWDTRELVEQLEHSVGRDLQFIRINGTLVGGLVGLALYALSQWLAP